MTSGRNNDSDLSANQFVRQRRQPIELIVGPTVLDTLRSRPSTYPLSFRPWRNPRRRSALGSGDWLLRNPIVGNVVCCARSPRGHAATAAAEERDELAPSQLIELPSLPLARPDSIVGFREHQCQGLCIAVRDFGPANDSVGVSCVDRVGPRLNARPSSVRYASNSDRKFNALRRICREV